MFNFYLATIGYENASIAELEESFKTLNIIVEEAKPEDTFLRSDTFWYIETSEGIFCEIIATFTDGQLIGTVCKLLESISSEKDFRTLDEIDTYYPQKKNAFWGACFEEENERHIDTEEKYHSFKEQKIQEITKGIEIWERRSLLFKRIELCPEVKTQLKSVGSVKQILKTLLLLDDYCVTSWNNGRFNENEAMKFNSALEISTESTSTNNNSKKKLKRLFKLPNGKTEYFDLHIKPNKNLRIYIFPDNLKIYIGYIGAHLPT
ncbi:hypothetical protein [Capnocytophaga sputigena]|uniref:hypothetical protein n=1 Tax=Capnocytophaga sputigena TaxID=1019 RepID=UPI0031F573EF